MEPKEYAVLERHARAAGLDSVAEWIIELIDDALGPDWEKDR